MMANSSPARRATNPLDGSASTRRTATSWSRRSPCWWPSVSFTSLKRSRSTSSTATIASPRSASGALELDVEEQRGSAAAVRASCRARCSRSADSLRRRSSSARFLSTTAAWAAIVSSRREVALVEAVDAAEALGDEERAPGDAGVGELDEHGVAGPPGSSPARIGALACHRGGRRRRGEDGRRPARRSTTVTDVALVRQHEHVVAVAADGELGPRRPAAARRPGRAGRCGPRRARARRRRRW